MQPIDLNNFNMVKTIGIKSNNIDELTIEINEYISKHLDKTLINITHSSSLSHGNTSAVIKYSCIITMGRKKSIKQLGE